jgi:L-iditol 2-dehydrogenase
MEFQDKPEPEIKSDEVLVKVALCGICGSDVHAYANGLMFPPGTLMGHELSGVIAEVGEGVDDWKPGARVTVKPWVQCEACHWCRKGQ